MLEVKSIIGAMRKASLIAAVPLLLNACADDISGPVDVYVSKGPIDGAECNLYRADTDTELASPVTTDKGAGSFGNVAFAGVAYVTCTGGTYTDEATGASVSAESLTLRAAKTISGGDTFVITPITDIAVEKAMAAEGGLEANADAFNRSVAAEFGLGALDITVVQPTDLSTTPAQDDAPGWYGTALAAFSQFAADSNQGMADVIKALTDAEDVAATGLADAMDNMAGNEHLQGNVNANVTSAVKAGLGEGEDGTPGQTRSGDPSDQRAPTVGEVSPLTGSAAGGTVLTITGSNFVNGNDLAVTIGGVAATVSFDSETQLTVTTPAATEAGLVDMVITNGNGVSTTVTDAFTFKNACEECELDANGCPF